MSGLIVGGLILAASVCNAWTSIANMRQSRRLRERRDEIVDLVGFVAAIGHAGSPVPDSVRNAARAALPSWVHIDYENVRVVPPSSTRIQ